LLLNAVQRIEYTLSEDEEPEDPYATDGSVTEYFPSSSDSDSYNNGTGLEKRWHINFVSTNLFY
jgi:hypothetical protein